MSAIFHSIGTLNTIISPKIANLILGRFISYRLSKEAHVPFSALSGNSKENPTLLSS
ncbi:MAG: hypothetical protein N2V75_09175 [Methanophagales archaeon]|nr:hypothetical protein [Methanophagales archaeon]